MKIYIRNSSNIETYRGYSIGFDSRRSEWYFMNGREAIYHPDIEGLYSLIDKLIDDGELE